MTLDYSFGTKDDFPGWIFIFPTAEFHPGLKGTPVGSELRFSFWRWSLSLLWGWSNIPDTQETLS